MRPASLTLLAATILAVGSQSTPVIGGNCKLGMQDVQIGGKQTQFFLKCEAASDSPEGDGVWVVKSRAASPPVVDTVQHRPSKKPANPNICEQDNGARESGSCAVSAMCLQADQNDRVGYLQCDQTTMRWVRKSCQDTFVFEFENQTCIVPKKNLHVQSRQPAFSAGGLVCTYSSCSNSNPCNSGTCNNGYCCSSGSSSPTVIVASSSNSGCNGCAQQAPILVSCPSGGIPVGSCNSGYCASGYSCVSGSCCPSYSAPQISVYTCPSGGSAVGACISGACSTGYTCVSGSCCPSTTTTNPFVCPDGTQAVGGCVNGQCGTGYTCSNGLCCAGTATSSVRCLDGSAAVGACIPSCTGNGCGGVTVTYYCGSGYTCTTGNICCAINSCPNGGTVLGPTVNGLCPTGYTAQNGICCSSVCADGSAGTPTVNGICPNTLVLTNGVCCPSTTANAPVGDCGINNVMAIGPCVTGVAGQCGTGNLPQPGYACDASLQQCCPVVNTVDPQFQIGPAVGGMCPVGYAVVYGLPTDTLGDGFCIDLGSVAGVCDASLQAGPCPGPANACPAGYTCNVYAELCCPTATAFRRIRPGQKPVQIPSYGKPLSSFMPPREMTCPDGSAASSGCMNGLCGVGLECHNGLCCPPQSKNPNLKSQCPNGEPAVSGCFSDGSCGATFECVKRLSLCCPPGGNEIAISSKSTVRPIGARCFSNNECVGSDEGLSLCHAGVCQCSPIAYSQGIACVRRKALSKALSLTSPHTASPLANSHRV